jgi:bZIP-type transcription factor MBZ1
MLLSSPSFSDFLDRLSSNPQQVPQPQQQQPQQQQENNRQVPKDVNPYTAQQHLQHQHISLAMIPEQSVDFNMLSMDTSDTFNYQPQVFSVLETPEPTLDAAILSGKSSNIVDEQFEAEDEKVEMPVIERPAAVEKEVAPASVPVDEKFESDPAFALYHDSPVTETSTPVELDTEGLSNVDIFGGIEPEKVLARYELVDASEDDAAATLAMARVQRISANLESVMARLESLTVGL